MNAEHPGDAKDFRRRLDDLLRQRDPAALRAFLIAEGQWQADTTIDAEKAMWMMVAGSPALKAQHAEAERWLRSHGYEVEAQAILGRRSAPPSRPAPHSAPSGKQQPGRQRPRKPPRPPQPTKRPNTEQRAREP